MTKNIDIKELYDDEWLKAVKENGVDKLWYWKWIRAFVVQTGIDTYVIYFKKSAKFLFKKSSSKLLAHEMGHINGKMSNKFWFNGGDHNLFFGIMAWHGLWRL